MVDATSSANTTTTIGFQHEEISAKIILDLSKGFNMQSMYESVVAQYPKDPTLVVVGVAVPYIGLPCIYTGTIDPISIIKDIVSRLYQEAMKALIKPIWKILNALFEALKKFGLGFLDFSLGIFDLHVEDLFSPGLHDKIIAGIEKLYYTEKEKLKSLLAKFGITFPLFTSIGNFKEEIKRIGRMLEASLWDPFYKIIEKITTLIHTGLLAFDIATYKIPTLSTLWKEIYDATIGKIISYFVPGFSVDDLINKLKELAKQITGKLVVSYQDLINAIEHFKLPVFGLPLDWKLPINIKVSMPNIDFIQIITDMKVWLSNFLVKIIQKFIELIGKILSVFGLNFVIPKFEIPISLCAVKIPST
jgi:hypothetical protein